MPGLVPGIDGNRHRLRLRFVDGRTRPAMTGRVNIVSASQH